MRLDGDTFRRLCEAKERLGDMPLEALSIPEVARQAGISPYHFIRQFEALFGQTPHQLRMSARIDHAKRLLAQGQMNVTEVCMEVGMSSLGSFSDLFLRRVGDTPSAYQRRARLLVQVPCQLPLRLFPGCLSLMAWLPESAFRNFQEARMEAQPVKFKKSTPGDFHAHPLIQHHGQ